MLSLVFITIIPVQTILLSNTLAFCILMEIVTEFKDLMKYSSYSNSEAFCSSNSSTCERKKKRTCS